jgi:hypothetical protein
MKRTSAVLMPFLLVVAGCLSPPIPQDLVDVGPLPAPDRVSLQEVVRLSRADLSDDVIIGLIRSRGIADRPGLAEVLLLGDQGVSSAVQLALVTAYPAASRPPEPRIAYRELFIPLWPSYARGRWHVGLRIGCFCRTVEEESPQVRPEEPKTPAPQPEIIDP